MIGKGVAIWREHITNKAREVARIGVTSCPSQRGRSPQATGLLAAGDRVADGADLTERVCGLVSGHATEVSPVSTAFDAQMD